MPGLERHGLAMHAAVSSVAMRSQRLFHVAGHRTPSRPGPRKASLRIVAGAYIGALGWQSVFCCSAHACHSALVINLSTQLSATWGPAH